jgi:hypothetical protein
LGDVVFNACPILKDFAAELLPEVEADINNIVCDFLACAGAAIGLRAYAKHLADTHPAATFHLLIAETTNGKGTVYACTNQLFKMAVPDWAKCVKHSTRSQQALYRMLAEVSQPEIVYQKDGEESESKPNPDYNGGRMLLRLSEISAIFKAFRAEWSTMSQGLREAFDGTPLSNERSEKATSIKVDSLYALGIIGDVTPWELSEVIEGVDFANGVANRFVWSVSHRSKIVPHATRQPDYKPLAARLARLIPAAPLGEITFAEGGLVAWDTWVYSLPLHDTGRLGSACGRMRANCLRLAVLFAVLDESRDLTAVPKMHARHVQAAAAIMDRHRATVEWFLARPARLPEAVPDNRKSKIWQRVEKVRGALKNGRVTSGELYKLFSNVSQDERTEIAKAAGLTYSEERDEKGNVLGVWS